MKQFKTLLIQSVYVFYLVFLSAKSGDFRYVAVYSFVAVITLYSDFIHIKIFIATRDMAYTYSYAEKLA